MGLAQSAPSPGLLVSSSSPRLTSRAFPTSLTVEHGIGRARPRSRAERWIDMDRSRSRWALFAALTISGLLAQTMGWIPAALSAQAQPVVLSGVLNIIWGDPVAGSPGAAP